MDNVKSGIAAELYDRQLELLKVNAKRYYNQDSLTYDVDDYIFVDQNEALEEAKQDLTEELRQIFGNEKNEALIELERIIENVWKRWEAWKETGDFPKSHEELPRKAFKKRTSRPTFIPDTSRIWGSQTIFERFKKCLKIFSIGFAALPARLCRSIS